MVADDHDYMRTIMVEVLRGAGVREIVGVSSAYEALELLPRAQPKMLITDWDMNGMDGAELARAIRAGAKKHRAIPIIMMSGESRRSVLELARESGVDEFIAKPVSNNVVMTRIRKLAMRPRIFIEGRSYIGPCRRRLRPDPRSPLRRLVDPTPSFSISETALQARAAQIVAHAYKSSIGLDPKDREKISEIFANAERASGMALNSTDRQLIRALHCLLRYLEGTGASGRLRADILARHSEAITNIIALPAHKIEEREQITTKLENVVTNTFSVAA